jgi:hypothetical protein
MVALFLLLFLATPADADPIAASDPSDISVTIYRAPDRGAGPMDREWPRGYAFITETRTVTLPAGTSVIRFEGVAEGLLPETAIVTGLPQAVREKNRDGRLISPGSLVDAYLKRRVHLRRTDRATGKVTEQDAIIQAGPDGGVVLQTAEGVEALGCSGLPERMLYDGVPAGLSARPTLSVVARSERAVTAKVQLSYLAEGFDWNADYVAQTGEAAGRMSLFGWLTVANGGRSGFDRARLQVVAGRANRSSRRSAARVTAPPLVLRCWPSDITSTHPRKAWPPPPPAPLSVMSEAAAYDDVIVTGMKREALPAPPPMAPVAAIQARQEELGDLKLYRVPERVSVAAKGQKQVAMIVQPRVTFDRLYVATADRATGPGGVPMRAALRTRNVKDKGLGVPLAAGRVALFEPGAGRALLGGQDDLSDKAVGEEVELVAGAISDVRLVATRARDSRTAQSWALKITSALDHPVAAEVTIPFEIKGEPPGVIRRNGQWVWQVQVPAHGEAALAYGLKMAAVE